MKAGEDLSLASLPIIKAAAINPIKYPPVGPIKTSIPPLPLAKTGNPEIPSNIYIT